LEISKDVVPEDRRYTISSRIELLSAEIISEICHHTSLESQIRLVLTSKLMAATIRNTTAFNVHVASPSRDQIRLMYELILLNMRSLPSYKAYINMRVFNPALYTYEYSINLDDASFWVTSVPWTTNTNDHIMSIVLPYLYSQPQLVIVPVTAAMRMLASMILKLYHRYPKTSFLTLRLRKARRFEVSIKTLVFTDDRLIGFEQEIVLCPDFRFNSNEDDDELSMDRLAALLNSPSGASPQ
jgi:hypothetical protein